jgi:uncharacterized phage protein (TIGR02220 family)
MFDNPVVTKDAEHLAVWVYLLHYATHTGYDIMFGGKRITLKPGQLPTSRASIARKLSISESKVQRILKTFEIEQQIEQQVDNRSRLITLINWDRYQKSEQQIEQQVNSNRTASEQQVNTHNNVYNNDSLNESINDLNDDANNYTSGKPDKYSAETYQEIISYLNEKAEKHFKWQTPSTKKYINGRLNEGFTVDDFKLVIDIKCEQWLETESNMYLRPETLFAPNHFQSYLNEKRKNGSNINNGGIKSKYLERESI